MFPVNLTSFSLSFWYFLVTGNIFLSFIISLSGGIIVTGDPVLTMNCFSVLSNSIVTVIWFLRLVKCFISVIIFIHLSVSFSSVSSASVIFKISCSFRRWKPHAFAKCPFYNCDKLILGLEICGPDSNLVRRNICNFELLSSFGLVPYWAVCVILCMGSSLMSSSRFDIRASGMLFFLFFRSYVFRCISSATFGTSKSFSSSSLSRNFLSVIDVINFDISTSVLKSGKSHSFSNSSSLSSGLAVFPYLFVLPEKKIRELYVSFRLVISFV